MPPLLFETKRWSVHLSSDIFYFFLYFLKKKVKILQKPWRWEDACYILHGNGQINIPKLSFVWMTFSQYLVCEEQWYFSHLLKCMIQLNLFFFFSISWWLTVGHKPYTFNNFCFNIGLSSYVSFSLKVLNHSASFTHKVKSLYVQLQEVPCYLYLASNIST